MKTSELTGKTLDYAVAKAQGFDVYYNEYLNTTRMEGFWVSGYYPGDLNSWVPLNRLTFSTDWSKGGSIIEREHIGLISPSNNLTMFWSADIGIDGKLTQFDHNPLIAAMRCYVASKFGDEIEIPKELL